MNNFRTFHKTLGRSPLERHLLSVVKTLVEKEAYKRLNVYSLKGLYDYLLTEVKTFNKYEREDNTVVITLNKKDDFESVTIERYNTISVCIMQEGGLSC